METWTHQMGFPIITIVREQNEIIATQDRFLLTTENMNSTMRLLPKSKFDYKWFVPLTYFTDSEREVVHNVWMNMTDGEMSSNISISKLTFFYQLHSAI